MNKHVNTKIIAISLDSSKTGNQQKIADLAYEFWLARGFRDGSPEEDLLRALCASPGIQLTARRTAQR